MTDIDNSDGILRRTKTARSTIWMTGRYGRIWMKLCCRLPQPGAIVNRCHGPILTMLESTQEEPLVIYSGMCQVKSKVFCLWLSGIGGRSAPSNHMPIDQEGRWAIGPCMHNHSPLNTYSALDHKSPTCTSNEETSKPRSARGYLAKAMTGAAPAKPAVSEQRDVAVQLHIALQTVPLAKELPNTPCSNDMIPRTSSVRRGLTMPTSPQITPAFAATRIPKGAFEAKASTTGTGQATQCHIGAPMPARDPFGIPARHSAQLASQLESPPLIRELRPQMPSKRRDTRLRRTTGRKTAGREDMGIWEEDGSAG